MPTLDIALPPTPSPSVLASLLGGIPEPSGRDRRAHERLEARELDWLKSARLRFGPGLSLIDLSAGGAQFETTAPLRPGSNAVLTITGRGVAETASFTVLRCEVASLEQGLVYRGACVFDRMIHIPGVVSQGSATLRQDPASHDEVVKLIRTLAARSADPARLGRVISEIRSAVERGESPDAVLHFVERELAAPTAAPARIRTAVPETPSAPRPAARTAAFPTPRPAPSVAAATPAPLVPPITAQTAPVPAPQPGGTHAAAGSGWNKLVVRYLDGTLLKGFSQDFHPTRPFFHVTPSIAAGAETSMVPMQQLKAVFFVRDFDGDPDHVESRTFAERTAGRKIEVTFADGELMVGSTLGYRPDGTGFFVRPADGDGNNLRVFVLPGGVKRVRYL
jgi:hypothetical protein